MYMKKIRNKIKKTLVLSATIMFLAGSLIPIAEASNAIDKVSGFDKGPSYTYVVPTKKTTFVGYDKDTLLDDYAYLAAVPTAVFNYEGKLVSHPLLYFEEEYKYEKDGERSFNAYQGIDYFMQDWMSYCDNEIDQMTLINVPGNTINSEWKAKDTVLIEGDNPYSIAADIALQDWSYSNDAVIAVIEPEYKSPETITTGKLYGFLDPYKIGKENYEMELPEVGATRGTPAFFEISDTNYKYLTAKLEWGLKSIDYDLQITDTQLGMLDIAMRDYLGHNAHGAIEVAGAYIHNYGKWEATVSAVPKKSAEMYEIFGDNSNKDNSDNTIKDVIKSMARSIKNTADLEITLYPGTDISLPSTPFGCKDIDFKLTWNNPSCRLGFTIIDPAGSEICSSIPTDEIIEGEIETGINQVDLHISLLGETRESENYSICVYSLDDVIKPIDFTLSYSWKQNFTKKEGDCFGSATNGAVLASKLNAPLLYISPSGLSSGTKNALYKLGVENIYLINIGSYLNQNGKEGLKEITENIKEYTSLKKIYDEVKLETDENTVVFTTIDPWTYWYVKELKPGGEFNGARFIGPATYIAAHHNCPVVIVENHPILSQSIVYHTDFWSSPYYKQHVDEANSGNMMITSNQVYDFLEEYGLGKLEKKDPEQQIREKIIIVAGQYDIGMSFDRSLTGAAIQGRFMFSPVDTAYWISRNIFYPALIFENPALKGDTLYINGSKSEVQGLGSNFVNREKKGIIKSILELGARIKNPRGTNLVITKDPQDEKIENPVLMTFNAYAYRFNQEASKHWGTYYKRADGIIPSITDSPDAIDAGSVPGKTSQIYPDISESEVVPFYAERAGYGSVFSTSFEPIIKNLNRGVIIWVENCHGWHPDGGLITLWDPNNPYCDEENPWRAYEPILLNPGNIRELLHFFAKGMGINLPEIFKFHLLSEVGSTQNPDVAHINTQLTTVNLILKKLNSPIDIWGAFGRMIYRDRIKHPLKTIEEGLPFINWFDGDGKITICPLSGGFTQTPFNGLDFDDALENLHSCGLNTISCLPAGTYLHLTWLRHGMTWQIIDPWTTTDWAGAWTQMVMKYFALGETVGEAYERGMRACGPEYSVGSFWWDIWENVCYFGDPDLRPYVPGTDYSNANHWEVEDTKSLNYDEELNLNGHMPYGATSYPYAKQPKSFLENYFIYILIIVAVILIAIAVVSKRKKCKKK